MVCGYGGVCRLKGSSLHTVAGPWQPVMERGRITAGRNWWIWYHPYWVIWASLRDGPWEAWYGVLRWINIPWLRHFSFLGVRLVAYGYLLELVVKDSMWKKC